MKKGLSIVQKQNVQCESLKYFSRLLAVINEFSPRVVYIVDSIIIFLPIVVHLTVNYVKFFLSLQVFGKNICVIFLKTFHSMFM